MTKVSVIIPVYNAAEYLEESIGSVLNQTLEDIELICVNDGSKDNSLEMLNDFAKKDHRVKVIDKPNGGCGSARNKALDNATGEFIYFFDPDDYILENCFEELYNNAINNDTDLVMFKIARFRDGEPINYNIPGFNFDDIFKGVDFNNFSFDYHDIKHYVLNASFAPWTKLYRKSFLDKYDDFRFPLGVAFDDVPYHVKSVLRAKSISFVPEFFYRYRLSNANSVNNTASNGIGIFRICDLVEEFLRNEDYFKEFREEFILFKITQVFNYLLSSNTDEYFNKTKSEFEIIKKDFLEDKTFNIKFIPKNLLDKLEIVLKSNSMEGYLLNTEITKLKQDNNQLQNKNRTLSNENSSIKNNLNSLSKEHENVKNDLKVLKKSIQEKSNQNNNSSKINIKELSDNLNILTNEINDLKDINEENNKYLSYKISHSKNIRPLISVIMPSYNVADYIEQCMESVLNQTLENIEIICVDANSTDGTLEILKEYALKDSRITLITSDKKSYGHQMNLALELVKGEYVGIVETDDYIKEDMFETLYNMTEDATVEISKVNFWHVHDDDPEDTYSFIDGTKKNLPTTSFTVSENENILNGHPCIWSAIYKTDFLKENNIQFMEEPGGGWVDNPFFFETFLLADSIKYKDEPYYYYRESNPNSSTNKLPNLNLPLERMHNNLDVFEKLDCNEENVLRALYVRIFWQVKDIHKKLDNNADNEEIFTNIQSILKRMDEGIVKKYFTEDDLTVYYKGLEKSRPLNVLLVASDNNKTSGAFLSMANLAVNLKNKYHANVSVIVPYENHGTEVLDKLGIKHTLIPSKDWVIPMSKKIDENAIKEINDKKAINQKAVEQLIQYIKENDIDIVHINTTYSYVAALACLQLDVPFVWHLREFLEEDQSNTLWDRTKGNELINKADRIIAISDSIYKKYERTFDKERLVRIHNGIDAERFYKASRSILDEEPYKLIMVGGFEYYKGQPEFADACIKVLKQGYTNIEVWFVGLGSKNVQEEVKAKFEEENLTDYVKFFGYKYDVENYYDKADISFTCAKSEAFGRTTVEAMLSGNLLIGADTAGTKELINNYNTGLLYKQGNSNDLAEKIIYAITHTYKSKNIAKKGRQYMFENMTAEINADNIYKLYEDVLNLNN